MNQISPVVQHWIQDAKDDPDAFWSRGEHCKNVVYR